MSGLYIWIDEFQWSRDVALDSVRGGYGGVIDIQSSERPESFQLLEQLMLEHDLGEAKVVLDFDIELDVDEYNAYQQTGSNYRLTIVSAGLYGRSHYDNESSDELSFVDIPMNVANAIYEEFSDDIASKGANVYYNNIIMSQERKERKMRNEYKDVEWLLKGTKQIENIAKMISEDVNEHFDVD